MINKSMSWVRNGRVNFNDRNSYNLTSANLSHTHADEPDNINRRIWRMGDYIFLYHKRSGQCYFCLYEEELFKLLCHHRIIWGYHPDLGRLRATVLRKKRKMKDFSFGFHTLVYAYHHYGARCNNFVGRIRQMQHDFKKKNLTIDHLDNCQQNNLSWNLSPMVKADNSAKSNLMGKIRYPFFAFAVYCNEEYRIVCGRVYQSEIGLIDPVYDAAYILCKDAKSLIGFLRKLLNTCWDDGVSPAEILEANPNAVCLQNYFGDFGATGIRKLLLQRDSADFELFNETTDYANLVKQ